ncbi:MAG TPA: hypothetical protein VHM90_22150 [Phycisphaerae bacterium]|nr:hypothetical protein [Phycisphaerae bacterium]
MSDASLDLALREQSANLGAPAPKRSPVKFIHRLLRGRYLWLAVFGVIFGGAGGYAGWKKGAMTFSSTGVLKVNYSLPMIYGETPETYLRDAESFFQEQIDSLTSQRVLYKALQNAEWAGLNPLPASALKDNNAMIVRAQQLASRLKVTQKNNQILIEGRDRDPRFAAAAARAVTDAYRSIYIDHEDEENRNLVADVLEKERKKVAGDITDIQKLIEPIASLYGSEKLDAQYDATLKLLEADERQIHEIDAIIKLNEKLKLAQEEGTTQPAVSVELSHEALAFADKTLADLDEAVQSLEIQLAQARLGTSATKVRSLSALLDEAKAKAERRYRGLLAARAAGVSLPNIPMVNDDRAIKEAQAKLDYLTDDSETLKAKLLEIGGHNRDLQKLHDQEDELQAQLKRIKGRLEQLSVEKPIQNRVELVKLGDMPLVADKDTRPKYGAVGGFGGLMAATGLVMLMGYLSGKVKAPDDLLFDLGGQPLIGLIPQLQKGNDASKLAATAAEYVHRSRTMLEIWAQGNQKMVIGVTSPSHGSGNTSVAMSLGVSFATAGLKTLLIDVDFVTNGLTPRLQTMVRRELGKVLLRCGIITEEKLAIARKVMFEEAGGKVNDGLAITPSANGNGNGHNGHNGHNGNGLNGMHVTNAVNPSAGTNKDKALGAACVKLGFITQEQLDKALKIQAREPVGLLDALSGEPLDNCIGKTGIRNLSLLPRGNVTPAHAAKLSSHSMRQVLAAARQNFDTVIVDTSAIPTSLEAAIVASTVDGMVMTVARGEKRSRLMDAMERLEAMGCPVAGVIFNHVRPKDMPPELNIGRVSTMNANAEDEETIRANAELVGRLAMLGPLASTMVSRVPLLDDKVSEDDQ